MSFLCFFTLVGVKKTLFLLTFTPFGEKKLTKTVFFAPTSVKIHILGNKVKNCRKTAANIFEYPGERKIFGKYLHREGLDGENFYILVFFSAQPDCSIHQILDFSDQPFMFFVKMSKNI